MWLSHHHWQFTRVILWKQASNDDTVYYVKLQTREAHYWNHPDLEQVLRDLCTWSGHKQWSHQWWITVLANIFKQRVYMRSGPVAGNDSTGRAFISITRESSKRNAWSLNYHTRWHLRFPDAILNLYKPFEWNIHRKHSQAKNCWPTTLPLCSDSSGHWDVLEKAEEALVKWINQRACTEFLGLNWNNKQGRGGHWGQAEDEWPFRKQSECQSDHSRWMNTSS